MARLYKHGKVVARLQRVLVETGMLRDVITTLAVMSDGAVLRKVDMRSHATGRRPQGLRVPTWRLFERVAEARIETYILALTTRGYLELHPAIEEN